MVKALVGAFNIVKYPEVPAVSIAKYSFWRVELLRLTWKFNSCFFWSPPLAIMMTFFQIFEDFSPNILITSA